MPKFYFTIVDSDILEDTEGTELPNLEAVREHARTVARELMHHRDGMLGHAWDKWTMIVKDDKGDEVFSFPIAETTSSSGE
jgi:Domain of unknown function (DUF6894)